MKKIAITICSFSAITVASLAFSFSYSSANVSAPEQRKYTDYFCERQADNSYNIYHGRNPKSALSIEHTLRSCGEVVFGNFFCERQTDNSYNLYHASNPTLAVSKGHTLRSCGETVVSY